VKEAIDRATTVLTDPVTECDPAMIPHLPEALAHKLLQPLTAHSATVVHLLATLARRISSPAPTQMRRGTGRTVDLIVLSSPSSPQTRPWYSLPNGCMYFSPLSA
jgi:hypothetical protein